RLFGLRRSRLPAEAHSSQRPARAGRWVTRFRVRCSPRTCAMRRESRLPSRQRCKTSTPPRCCCSSSSLPALNECLNAQPERQLFSVIQFDQRFQHLGIDTLGRLVGSNILFPEHLANTNDVTSEPPIAERIGGHVRGLPHP